ncbi:YARHG domain-containing protein [Flavivirga amylovorans]|uniref:YARHG domain-containing protein n=1 Tax=Flavivirga amylovorans TaxID=870486 RepID=A0ABT8WYW8_9FLAO|nr:YARHG domain-containing protein [Flavivirga amylovorans]MDO5986863.1 YARHG domain-containing protein [Flavivirga amylovorans]
MKKILFLLILIPTVSLSQLKFDKTELIPWIASDVSEYEGAYLFVFLDEEESKINIAIEGKIICAQRVSVYRSFKNIELIDWDVEYFTYTNVKISGNKFFSNETSGEFVIKENRGWSQKYLKLDIPLGGVETQFEFGFLEKDSDHFSYKQTTEFEIMKDEYIRSLSLEELRIMRNEIFAKYGYIFREGGKMDRYFKKQEWYRGIYENVDDFLTDIEKANISAIQKVEQEKKSK